MDVTCNECEGGDWTKIVETDYPENRNERDRTVKHVYICQNCGAEGKRFVHKDGGPDIFSGAMR